MKNISYDRDAVRPGILHIGVGNFHRAHLAYYINCLLSRDPSQANWGICGVMLLPGDERLYHALSDQKDEYTLTVCSRDGDNECYQIGSIVELLWSGDNAQAILDRFADPYIRILSMTITEGGYNIDKVTGEFDLENNAVSHDLKYPKEPETVFGYVAEGLCRRRDSGAGGLTILTCDNLQHNGDTARKAFTTFFRAQDPELAEWVEQNVTFPNSMVDRITPATLPQDVKRLNHENGTKDAAPVYCEDFIQWVVEENFAAGRPDWEQVGVQMTDDVTAYENMKLSLLNASHTLLSYPSFLSGYRKVDDAMTNGKIVKFIRDFMDLDVTPYVPAPKGIDLDEYKQTLIERFGNRQVSDQIARLCFDGLSKFPVYITPTLTKMVGDGRDLTRMAYLLAVYRHYLRHHRDDNGEEFEVAEPQMTEADRRLIESDDPVDFLRLPAFAGAGLEDSDEFKRLYFKMIDSLKQHGTMGTLENII